MNTTRILYAAPLILLSACQTIPSTDDAPVAAPSYKALGTEPFWSLNIDGDTMVFDRAGMEKIAARNVKARPSFNGWRYTAENMTVDVTFGECSDGMSDRTYKDRVTVMTGDAVFKGCGGGIAAPKTLEGTSWRVSSIDGTAIPNEREAAFLFENGRMSGSIGCNRLNATYSYERQALSAGPVMSTRMACPDPIGAQESALTGLLGSPFATEFPGDGSMVLSGPDGARIILVQQI